MRTLPLIILVLLLPLSLSAQSSAIIPDSPKEAKSLLVFTKTAGWRHGSIDQGVSTINKMSQAENWTMTVTEDANHFTKDKLKRYNGIIFLNTTGDILNEGQQDAFIHYIHNGGGFVGIHAASDTEHGWPWYGALIGGQFKSHPKIQEARLNIHHENNHPSIAHLDEEWAKKDEWYNFKAPLPSNVNVLLDLDESSYEGKQMGGYHPIAWYHHYEGGRVFYTGLGHAPKTFQQEEFSLHLKEGIKWAIGLTHVPLAEEWTDLLDADFTHWDKFIGVPHTSVPLPDDISKSENVHEGTPLGLNNDPLGVFTMVKEDGEDLLKINGQIYGGLTSKQEYGDYHLQLQFKWADKKWPPRLKAQRDNGLLYHCTGPHGVFWNVWMRCLEFQIQERDMGDFFALAGTNAYGLTAGPQENKQGTFQNGGERMGIGNNFGNYRNTRSTNEELGHGEWNTLELYTLGGRAIHVVNGKVVNAIDDAHLMVDGKPLPLVRGKIQLQSEAADGFFRRVRIRGIKEIPADILKEAGF